MQAKCLTALANRVLIIDATALGLQAQTDGEGSKTLSSIGFLPKMDLLIKISIGNCAHQLKHHRNNFRLVVKSWL